MKRGPRSPRRARRSQLPAPRLAVPRERTSRRSFRRRRSSPAKASSAASIETRRSDNYYQVKATIFGALIEAIDLAQLAKLDGESAREEIRDIVNEIIAIKNIVMSIAEQEELLDDICNDVLGYGPLEPLLSRDDISDIMVNGAGTVFIEVAGTDPATPASGSATTSNCSTSASASSARSAAASTNPRRSATRASPTARASTPSCRRWRSTARHLRSANSRKTS